MVLVDSRPGCRVDMGQVKYGSEGLSGRVENTLVHRAMVIRRRDAEAGADADAETQMTD